MKTSSTFYFIFAGALILILLFFIFKPKAIPESLNSPSPTATMEASPSASPLGNVFEIVIKQKKLVSGPETISVTQGDQITIKITADEDDELHVHGYDKSVDLTANQPAELNFTTNLSGRFPYELEESKTEIGALEVQPK